MSPNTKTRLYSQVKLKYKLLQITCKVITVCEKRFQRWQGMAGLSNLPNKSTAHRSCAVVNCFDRTDNRSDIPYQKFPADKILRKQWELATGREEKAFCEPKHHFVCGEHFLPSDYRRSLTGRYILAPGTIPSQNTKTSEKSPSTKRVTPETAFETTESDPNSKVHAPSVWVVFKYLQPQVESNTLHLQVESDTKHLEELEKELAELRREVPKLRQNAYLTKFGRERFSACLDDICFYLGFSDYWCLLAFSEKIKPCANNLTRWDYVRRKVKETSSDKFPYLTNIEVTDSTVRPRALQPIDEFFMVLNRLRLGLFEKYLGHRFGVSLFGEKLLKHIYQQFLRGNTKTLL